MIRDVAAFLVAMFFVGAMVFGWMTASHASRIRRVRRQYYSMTPEARDRILDTIDSIASDRCACTVLVAKEADPDSVSANVHRSHFGGRPYSEATDVWPSIEPGGTQPADFLIQVLFDDSFPPPWPGRLVVIFLCHDGEQTVRCYASAASDRFVAMTGGPEPQNEWNLRPVRIPRQQHDSLTEEASGTVTERLGLLDYDPVVLLESVPDLREKLAPFTPKPADLLAAILSPNHCSYGFELCDLVQLGGKPVWLQEDIDGLSCDRCGESMRFLFQFGDLNGGNLLGDTGVCYVFGCDEHPDQPRAFVQMC